MVTSVAAEHGLQGTWASVFAARGLSSSQCVGSVVVARLVAPTACVIFLVQGWKPCPQANP